MVWYRLSTYLPCYQLLHQWQAMTPSYKMGDWGRSEGEGRSGMGWGECGCYLMRLSCTEMIPVRSLAELRKYALSLVGF